MYQIYLKTIFSHVIIRNTGIDTIPFNLVLFSNRQTLDKINTFQHLQLWLMFPKEHSSYTGFNPLHRTLRLYQLQEQSSVITPWMPESVENQQLFQV